MEVYEFYFNFDREWKFMRCITYKNIHLVIFCLHTQNTFFMDNHGKWSWFERTIKYKKIWLSFFFKSFVVIHEILTFYIILRNVYFIKQNK